MSRVPGAIYAPGSDPDNTGGRGATNANSFTPYSQYPSYGYGHGHGQGLNQMILAPPPCDSRDGSALFNRGSLRIEWANAGVNVPLGRLLGADPGVQNNLMSWGSDSAHRYTAPAPAPAPAPDSGASSSSLLAIAPPAPKQGDIDDDEDDDQDDDNDDTDDDTKQQCNGPSCTHNPALLKDVREVVIKGKGKKNKKSSNGKAKTTKWLCWNCCWYEFGYPAAEKAWSKAKKA